MTPPTWLAGIRERAELAHREICDLASGKRKWRMCVPVQKDDSDMTLQAPLDDIPKLIKAVEILSTALRQIAPQKGIVSVAGYLPLYEKLATDALAQVEELGK